MSTHVCGIIAIIVGVIVFAIGLFLIVSADRYRVNNMTVGGVVVFKSYGQTLLFQAKDAFGTLMIYGGFFILMAGCFCL